MLECVPNVSERRDRRIIERLGDAIRGVAGVRLADVHADPDHHRSVSGGLPALQVPGLPLARQHAVQVSMNLLDHRVTSLARDFDAVAAEAARRGIASARAELVGLVPRAAFDHVDIRQAAPRCAGAPPGALRPRLPRCRSGQLYDLSRAALPKHVPGRLLIADNVVSHAAELEDYVGRVKSHPALFSVPCPSATGNLYKLGRRHLDGVSL